MDMFEILNNVNLNSFNYKRLNNNSIEQLKKYCLNDEFCVGFTDKDMMKFFINKNEMEEGEDTIYIHKLRYEEIMKNKEQIPKKIHFIWFSKGRQFNLVNYIAIKAALYHNPEYQVYLHCDAEPDNEFYDKLKDKIYLNKINEPKTINEKEVHHFQHKADFVRLNILKTMGGIYLDTDYILLKNLDSFLDNHFVMAKERPESDEYLCNCVIMTTPNNKIVNEWLHIYKNSWGEDFIASWMGHSVIVPGQLRKKHNMTIYESYVFYPFLWNDLSILHKEDNLKEYKHSIGVHLWDTEASKTALLPLDVNYFKNKSNAFVRLFKKHVEDLEEIKEIDYDQLVKDEFLVFEGKDHFGDDIRYRSHNDINDLIDYCISDPNCVGFNTIGFMKNKIHINNLKDFPVTCYNNISSKDKLYVYKKRLN